MKRTTLGSTGIELSNDGARASRGYRAVVLTASAVMALVSIAMLIGSGSLQTRILLAILLAFVAILLFREAMVRVGVSREGVVVVNPIRSHRITWEDFERFELRPWFLYRRVGHVVMTDDRALHAVILIARGPLSKNTTELDQALQALDRAVQTHRPPASPRGR